jgi:cytochrome c556
VKASRRSLILSFALIATPLLAAPQDAAATRSAGYRAMGAAFKAVNDQLRSGSPQMPVLQAASQRIQATAKAQYGWFPQGSGPAPGVKTAAKPEIWAQPAQFKAAQDNFATQANAFAKAVNGGNVAAITAQTKQLGGACSACHKVFRSDAKS